MVLLSSIHCNQEEIRGHSDFWEMNKKSYLWPICEVNMTCIVFSCNSLVEYFFLSYVNFIYYCEFILLFYEIHEMSTYMLVANILILGHVEHCLHVNLFH